MKKLTTEEFVTKAMVVHEGKYSYENTNYVLSRVPTTITCSIHGDYLQTPNDHLSGAGCHKCGYGRQSKAFTVKDFVEKAKSVHGDTYDYSITTYVNMKTPVQIICKTHGIVDVHPDAHTRGTGCRKCADEANSANYTFTPSQFKERSALIHNGYYDYTKSVYTKAIEKLTITCPVHGDFEQTAISHLQGHGCLGCVSSSVCYTSLPTTLYYVRLELNGILRYKVGITSKDVYSRFRSELLLGMKLDTVYTYDYLTGRDAFLEEQRLLQACKTVKSPLPGFLYRDSGISELLSEGSCEIMQQLFPTV